MLRSLPGALDPGPRPTFCTPADVMSWAGAVDWIVNGQRNLVLHLDGAGRPTCVAVRHHRHGHYVGTLNGPPAGVDLAAGALACDAASVVVLNVRRRLPANGITETDRRRHRELHRELAVLGVALLDTVIVTPAGSLSVTDVVNYPAAVGPSWLQIHVPLSSLDDGSPSSWAYEEAAFLRVAHDSAVWGEPAEPA